jgi:23S rRNA (uracil1939-C5)-methyltransferase
VRLTIESLAYGGAGVAHAPDGIAVFVQGACPGDVVEAEVTEQHPRHLLARTTALIEPSADRVVPPCPYFDTCGGCQWQHIALEAQHAAKRRAVADALCRIAKLDIAVREIVPSPRDYGYRNKIELTVVPSPSGPVVGFARQGTADIISIDECLLLPASARRAPKALRGAIRYLAGRSETQIDRVSLRVATTGDVEVDVWTPPGSFPRQLGAKVLADAVGARTVTRVIAKGPGAARDVVRVEVLAGRGAWREQLAEDTYLVSAPSFFQVNTRAAVTLRAHVEELAAESAPEVVADVYAGVGTFTLPLARVAPTVAVEGSSHALADLRRNLDAAGLEADILPGDAEHALEEVEGVDLVVVDPPRSGLGATARQALVGAHPDRIIYVSCDPATLARDAAMLAKDGYALVSATPFDLFPQTYHVETVASFSR